MYTDVNLDALKRLVRNNERAPDFDLNGWFHPCGTFGCLVGNDFIATYPNNFRNLVAPNWTIKEYGITHTLSAFLFSNRNLSRTRFGIECTQEKGVLHAYVCVPRDSLDREAALNRVRKYIAYVERKRAMLHEPDGRISERARRQEGNWMVCPKVLESLATAV